MRNIQLGLRCGDIYSHKENVMLIGWKLNICLQLHFLLELPLATKYFAI